MNLLKRTTLKKVAALALCAIPALSFAQVGVTDKEIVIGQFAATTGPAAELGLRMQMGMHIYFSAINGQGGVHGRKIRLVTRDDGYEPKRSVEAVKTLIHQDKVFALAGSVGTPTGLAALPILTEAQVPLVGMFTGARALREPFNRYVFHVRASYDDETDRIVQHLAMLGIQRIGVLKQNDSYGQAVLDGVQKALTKRKIQIAAIGTVERNSKELGNAVKILNTANVEAIIQASTYQTSAAFIKQARAEGFRGHFFNVSFVGAQALANELGELGQGVSVSQVVPFPFSTNTPLLQEYRNLMNWAGQKEYDFTSMEGFLTAKIMVEGLRRAGTNLTRERLITGLESMRDVNLGGFTVKFSPQNHVASDFTDLTVIARDKKFMH
ncbi:MAG: Leucine, isoleucine, valine-, threonine-, and alanine-binding protein [Pseudomonadota bacterium]|jgi:ABC-type branched-subunit amino acid transport system substrate-binding protein